MQTDIKTVDTILSALGIGLPVDLLSQIDFFAYLDQLDDVLALAAGEPQRLGDLLRAAERITSAQLDETLAEQRRGNRKFGEILIENGLLTERERDAVLEFQKRQSGVTPVSGKFVLGNILVASGEITWDQLESALLHQARTGRRLGEELIEAGYASKGEVEGGLLLQNRLIAYALTVALGLAPLVTMVPSAQAAQRSAAMTVSVTVVANAKMEISYQATQLTITEADITRGYVEVPGASRFSVRTNSRTGYLMEFHPVANVFESVHVGGLGNAVQFGVDGGSIVQRGPLASNLTHELSFRFNLRPEARPGLYPWPLQLSVRAI
jgi:hypothetical protein